MSTRNRKTHQWDPLSIWMSVFHSHMSPICCCLHPSCLTPYSPTLYAPPVFPTYLPDSGEAPPTSKLLANECPPLCSVANRDAHRKQTISTSSHSLGCSLKSCEFRKFRLSLYLLKTCQYYSKSKKKKA